MTVWLRDCSDYDLDPISFGNLVGLTHKATEGTLPHSVAEGTELAARLNAARAAGVPVLGAYHVLRTPGNGGAGTLAQQLSWWVARLDDQVPWWRDWPHWVMQIDAEKWPYDPDMPDNVLEFAALLVDSGLPGWKVTYASHGQYGDSLAGISTPLWNANYGSGTGAYPGDSAAAWAPYSGTTPTFLQFSGGPDMNAYRGTLDQLLTMIGGDMSAQAESILAALANGGKTYTGDDGQQHEFVPTTEIYRQIAFRAAMEALPPAAAPTQDQVDAAVAKVMNDPAWLTSLGAAVASHIHVA